MRLIRVQMRQATLAPKISRIVTTSTLQRVIAIVNHTIIVVKSTLPRLIAIVNALLVIPPVTLKLH